MLNETNDVVAIEDVGAASATGAVSTDETANMGGRLTQIEEHVKEVASDRYDWWVVVWYGFNDIVQIEEIMVVPYTHRPQAGPGDVT